MKSLDNKGSLKFKSLGNCKLQDFDNNFKLDG